MFTSPSTVNFVDACPPSKNLALNYRQVHKESRVSYTRAIGSCSCDTWSFIDILEDDDDFDEDELEEQFQTEKSKTEERGKEHHEQEDAEAGESERQESGDAESEEAENQAVDEEKKDAVYAKVQELRDEDVAHITRMHMPCTKSSAHILQCSRPRTPKGRHVVLLVALARYRAASSLLLRPHGEERCFESGESRYSMVQRTQEVHADHDQALAVGGRCQGARGYREIGADQGRASDCRWS